MSPPIPIHRFVGFLFWKDGSVTWKQHTGGAALQIIHPHTSQVHHFRAIAGQMVPTWERAGDERPPTMLRFFEEHGEPEPSVNNTRQKIARMLRTEEYLAPDKYDDLPDGILFVTECYRDPWCPPDLLPLLRRWLKDAATMLTEIRR